MRRPLKIALFAAAGLVIAVSAFILFVVASKPDHGRLIDDERNLWTGAPWDGDAGGDLSEEEVRRFKQTPVYWFGPSIEEYNLTHLDGSDDSGSVTMIYGSCEPRGSGIESSCPAVISLEVQPLCRVLPAVVKGGAMRELPGGAPINVTDHDDIGGFSALIWTGSVALRLHVRPASVTLEEAIGELEAIALVQHGAGEPLPAPDFSIC